jgi:outer membrane protein
MKTRFIHLIAFFFFLSSAGAQEKWDLRQCVDYALKNNITVRQADLQVAFAKLNWAQSRMAMLPGANFSSSVGYSSGRNQDPTNFGLITTGYTFNSTTLQASVDIFNWFTKKNTVAANALDVDATLAGAEKARNDIALNVAVAYLQVLLAKEQITLAEVQVSLSKANYENTRKQVDAGKLPELNAVNLQSILATDSASLVSAQVNANQLLLQLKALLHVDPAMAFDIATPPVDQIPVESLGELQPDAVYNLAMANMPQQKVDQLNLDAALKRVKAARGAMYPTFSLFGSLGSSFNDQAREVKSKTQVLPPLGTVTVGGTPYQVFPLNPYDVYTYGNMGYFDQLNQNFRQSIGINLSIPILNGGSLKTAWQRSRLTVKQVELQKEQNSFTLKQDIYKAYNDALAAIETFNANKKAVASAQQAYDFANKRYELNLLSTFDLITTQTNLAQAKSRLLYSQYDYVFKLKLLEFYKGQGLKL